MRTMSRRAAGGLLLIMLIGCGDGLSSLDAVQKSARQVYAMNLDPDWARRGATEEVTVEFDSELKLLLDNARVAYPTEIFFGEQINIENFGTVEGNTHQDPHITFGQGRRAYTHPGVLPGRLPGGGSRKFLGLTG